MRVHISPLRFRQALRLLAPFLFAVAGLAMMSLTVAQSSPLQPLEEATETSARPIEPERVNVPSSVSSISGTVTALGGTPLSGIEVTAYMSQTWGWDSVLGQSTTTDISGRYQLADLDSGIYAIGFRDSTGTYAFEYYDDALTLNDAQLINFTGQSTIPNINAVLSEGGQISGTVTMYDGESPDLWYLDVYHHNGFDWEQVAWTSDMGPDPMTSTFSYTVGGLATGNYRLHVSGEYQGQSFGEYYDNVNDIISGTNVPVIAGSTTPNINIVLGDQGGRISGQVTSPTSVPLANIEVTAYISQTWGWDSAISQSTTTDMSGAYQLVGLEPGNYVIRFRDSTETYAFEYYDDALTLNDAELINLTEGSVIPNINAVLSEGGQIGGTVTMYDGESPDSWYLDVYHDNGFDWEQVAWSDSMGDDPMTSTFSYTVGGLATGNYRLHISGDYQGQSFGEYYDNATDIISGTNVSVIAGSTTPNINVVLGDQGGRISGQVTSPTSAPLANIEVTAYISQTWGWDSAILQSTTTDMSGAYQLVGLAPGNYVIRFRDSTGTYAFEYYDDALTLNDAELINLTEGSVIPNINAVLSEGGQISGMVTMYDGESPDLWYLEVYHHNGFDWEEVAWSDSMGADPMTSTFSYTVGGLATGDYRLYIFGDYQGQFFDEYYDNVNDIEHATDVSVIAGSTTPNINVVLGNLLDPSPTPTATATATPANPTPSATGSVPTNTPSATGSVPTNTPIVTATVPTNTPTATGSVPTNTPTATGSVPTNTPSPTGSVPTNTPSPTGSVPTNTPSPTGSVPTNTPSPTGSVPTNTPVVTATVSTSTPSATGSVPTNTPSATGIPTVTSTNTPGPSPTASNTATATGIPTVTSTNTPGPSPTASNTPTTTNTPITTNTPTSTPTATSTPTGIPPAEVLMSAPSVGYTNMPQLLEVYVDPFTATTPMTYTWQATDQPLRTLVGDLDSWLDYTWSTPGVKTVVVTASNAFGAVSTNHQIVIESPPEPLPDTPPITVTLSGPDRWDPNTSLSLFANVNPTATLPITFSWQATDQAPITQVSQMESEVQFTWSTPGVKTILVTASNPFGSVNTTHQITINPGTPPATVTLAGPDTGFINDSQPMFAEVSPFSVTWPVTYTWEVSDHPLRTTLDGSVNGQDYTWSTPGVKTVLVTASNPFGTISASRVITISNDTPGSISGSVSYGRSATGLSTSVEVYQYNDDFNNWQFINWANIAANGQYQVDDLRAGTYRVGFFDWNSGQYAPKYYLNGTDLESATDVIVQAGQNTPNIDMTMDEPGRISGTVIDPDGNPLEEVSVQAYQYNGNWWDWAGWAQTNAQGHYTVTGLITGTYRVGFFDWDLNDQYPDKYYQNATDLESATDVTVTLGNTTSGINVQLDSGGRITGTVTNNVGNTPLANIEVQAYQQNGNDWQWAGWAFTDNNGQYTLSGLNSGTYRVSFTDWQGIYGVQKYYQNANDFDSATDVSVTIGQVTPNIDMSLPEPGSITGTVTTHLANPAPNIYVRLYEEIDGQWEWLGNWTQTNSQGQYEVRGLLSNSYRVGFFEETNTFAYEYYSDTADLASGIDVTVTDGNITPDINAQLPAPVDPVIEVDENDGQSIGVDPQTGEVTISQPSGQRSDVTITKVVTCTNSSPTNVMLIMGSNEYAMTEESPGSGIYSATIPRNELEDGAELAVSKDCGGGSEEENIGQIELYDPSGYLTDAVTGEPVVGASVTLYKVPEWQAKNNPQDNQENTCQSNNSKAPDDPWSQAVTQPGIVANPDSGEIDPAQNPLISNEDGYYAWDVAAGCWYVVVEVEGYETLTSTVVGVPPEVTDLNLELTPLVITATFTATPLSGVAPLTVTFTDTSTGTITNRQWDFGDGMTSTLTSPSHTYTTDGVYTVTLTVSGVGGTDTLTRTNYITVYEAVAADFGGTPTNGVAPLTVDFTNSSTGDYDTCSWTFGDGNSSSDCNNPSHTYTTAGVYSVTLTVSGEGGTDTQTRTNYITVYEAVAAGFSGTPTNGVAPLTVDFTNNATGDYDTCSWDFGDDNSSSNCNNPSHTYSTAGVYTVTLTVSGDGGADTQTRTNYITVYEAVMADFSSTPTNGVAPLTVDFTNSSTGDYDSCSWDFGDGNSSSDCNNPSHTYSTAGVYSVTLTVSGDGGTDTQTRTNYITVSEQGEAPEANFTGSPTSGMAPLTVAFTNSSTGDYDTCSWTFGDSNTSSDCNNPSHTYTTAGVYTVTLTVSGDGGTDTQTRTNYITTNLPSSIMLRSLAAPASQMWLWALAPLALTILAGALIVRRRQR